MLSPYWPVAGNQDSFDKATNTRLTIKWCFLHYLYYCFARVKTCRFMTNFLAAFKDQFQAAVISGSLFNLQVADFWGLNSQLDT